MSIKTELQSNNTDIQSLIDLANSLPVAENLDTELSEQDSLISQIAAALEGKSVGGGSSVELIEGTLAGTMTDNGPEGYQYTWDLSVIPDVNSKKVIVLYSDMTSGGTIVTIVSNDMSVDAHPLLGRGVTELMRISYVEYKIMIYDAVLSGSIDYTNVKYYAI